MARIVVLGGYGVFGQRAVERLARRAENEVVIAGRDRAKAQALAATVVANAIAAGGPEPVVEAVGLDAMALMPRELRALRVQILINTIGPFQGQDYRVARAAIAAGCHYIDLADARAFVTGIGALDAEARTAGVLVVSGASSVPALAAAVIDEMARELATIETVRAVISPGNSFDPGPATTAAILSGVGRPHTRLTDGRWQVVYGWQPLARQRIEGAGTRWLGACDVPDLDLFPARYPSLSTQEFLAGVEVKAFHLGLYALSWLVRARLVGRPERLARPLLAIKRRLGFLGSDRGAMVVEAEGRGRDGAPLRLRWTLVAAEGHGPFIPATPAVIVARGLAEGRITALGAMPCLGLVTPAEATAELADLAITQRLERL
jgi:hypothetical protein